MGVGGSSLLCVAMPGSWAPLSSICAFNPPTMCHEFSVATYPHFPEGRGPKGCGVGFRHVCEGWLGGSEPSVPH